MTFRNKGLVSCVFVLLFIFSSGTGCEEEETFELQEGARPHEVFGGEPTEGAEEWSGVVGIGFSGMSMCSGTLIDEQVVLTAGHCVKMGGPMDFSNMPSLLGILGGAKAGQTLARGQKIVVHPSWEGELSDGATDMSLIKLNKKVTKVPHYRLRDYPMPEAGDDAILVGYGMTGDGTSSVQHIGETKILSVTPNLLETGGPGQAGICSGDSGGPVFTQQDGEWVVSAVNSFGVDTGCTNDFGAHSVNTLADCHWLNSKMIELVGHDLGLESCSLCKQEPACNWGRGCGPNLPDCPYGSTCITPKDFSQGGYGFCSAPCCEIGTEDTEYCSDVAGGEERCNYRGGDGNAFCLIYCEEDTDCPQFTICKQKPFAEEKICIATADTVVDGIDTDSDTIDCPEPDPEEDAGADTDVDTDTDTDADTDVDTDADADSDEDAGEDDGSSAGCGCHQAGRSTRATRLPRLVSLFGNL
ncbi:MAG: trypsin-like serine protease [Deltaproteobacteria bacterium]|nr:trypsin-like serine protease [Deltaproteobacteria bacterium]